MATIDVNEYQVGRRVQLVLKSQTKISGVVFALDVKGNRVVLEETIIGAPSTLRDTRVINLAAVESAKFEPISADSTVEVLSALTKEQALRREKVAFRAREEALLRAAAPRAKAASVKPSPTDALAKAVFDNFAKMYDCQWHDREKRIDIRDLGVTITYPFRADDVQGANHRAVSRVKDVLSKIHLPK